MLFMWQNIWMQVWPLGHENTVNVRQLCLLTFFDNWQIYFASYFQVKRNISMKIKFRISEINKNDVTKVRVSVLAPVIQV